MNIVEVLPAPPLRDRVDRYWFLTGDAREPGAAEPIVPDGSPEIVVHLADPFRRFDSVGGRSESRQPRALFGAQIDRPLRVEPCGVIDLAGIRFRPFGAFAFVGAPMDGLLNATPSLSDVAPRLARQIEPALLAAGPRPEDRARALDSALLSASLEKGAPRGRDPRVALAVRRVEVSRGGVSVDALARAVSLSPRQLERAFLREVGLAPKRFARVVRFQEVIRSRASEARPSWAAIAHDLGYTDQAHLVRDFRELAGVPPAAYFGGERGLSELFLAGMSDFDNTGSVEAPSLSRNRRPHP